MEDLAVIYVIEHSAYVFKSFIVFGLTLRSLIHFKFISVYGIKYKVGIQLYSFTYEYQVSPAIFVEPHSFIH